MKGLLLPSIASGAFSETNEVREKGTSKALLFVQAIMSRQAIMLCHVVKKESQLHR